MNAFYTVTTDGYMDLTRVLVKSIKKNGHKEDIIIGHDKKELSTKNQTELKNIFGAKLISFSKIECPHCKPLQKRWNSNVLLKLNAFSFEEYDKVLVLDSDCLLLDSVSELFKRRERHLFTSTNNIDKKSALPISGASLLCTPDNRLYKEIIEITKLSGYRGGKWLNTEEDILRAKFSNYTICKEWRKQHNITQETEGVGMMGREYNTFYSKDEMRFQLPHLEKIKIFHFCNWGFRRKPNEMSEEELAIGRIGNEISEEGFSAVANFYQKYYQLKKDG